MKNKLYILGILSCILIIAGGVLKINHWPGAGISLTLGLCFFCFIFLPFAIISSYKDSGRKKTMLYIAAFITIFVDFMGALFKIMHWPGAGIMMLFGITFPIIVFLPVYLYFHYREREESISNFMYIMFFLVYLSVMSALLSINVSREILNNVIVVNNIMDNAEYYELKRLKGVKDYRVENHETIQIKTNELLKDIDNLKNELIVAASEKNMNLIKQNNEFDLWELEQKDDNFKIEYILFGGDNNEKAIKLRHLIEDYKSFLFSEIDNNPNNIKVINNILSTEKVKMREDYTLSWEGYNFGGKRLVSVLNTLDDIQNNIRKAELEALSIINKKSGKNKL